MGCMLVGGSVIELVMEGWSIVCVQELDTLILWEPLLQLGCISCINAFISILEYIVSCVCMEKGVGTVAKVGVTVFASSLKDLGISCGKSLFQFGQ